MSKESSVGSGRFVRPLSEAHDPTSFGNKAASLALLISHGIAVPPGFVVSFDAYRRVVGAAETSDSTFAIYPNRFPNKLFDKGLVDDIAAHYDSLRGQDNENRIIVRSSSNAEDSISASFAGQFNTILGVEDLQGCLQAIWKCWISGRSENVLAYCEKQGIDPADLKMGVIVQLQRKPNASGVLLHRILLHSRKV